MVATEVTDLSIDGWAKLEKARFVLNGCHLLMIDAAAA
jgi:hypothetical protein